MRRDDRFVLWMLDHPRVEFVFLVACSSLFLTVVLLLWWWLAG